MLTAGSSTQAPGYRQLLMEFVAKLAALCPDVDARASVSHRTNLLEETVNELLTFGDCSVLPSREITLALVTLLDPLQVPDWERSWLAVERAAWAEAGAELINRITQLDRQRAFQNRDGVRRSLIETLDPLRRHVPYRAPHYRARGLFLYTDLRLWTWPRRLPRVQLPVPEEARTREEFAEKLRQLKTWVGASLDEIVRREWDRLARSTLDGALKRRPTSADAVATITEACGLPRCEVQRWLMAYARIEDGRGEDGRGTVGTAIRATPSHWNEAALELADGLQVVSVTESRSGDHAARVLRVPGPLAPPTAQEPDPRADATTMRADATTTAVRKSEAAADVVQEPTAESAVAGRIRLLTWTIALLSIVVAVLGGAQIAMYLRLESGRSVTRILDQQPQTLGPGHPAQIDLSRILLSGVSARLVVHLSVAAGSGPGRCIRDSRLRYRLEDGGTTVWASPPLPAGQTRSSLPAIIVRPLHAPTLDVWTTANSGCRLVLNPSGTQATPQPSASVP